MKRLALCGAIVAALGCAAWEDFDPPVAREIPEGPGVLSGPDGELAVEADLPGERDEDDESDAGGSMSSPPDSPTEQPPDGTSR